MCLSFSIQKRGDDNSHITGSVHRVVKIARPDVVGGTAGIITIPQRKNDVLAEARHIVSLAPKILCKHHDIALPCGLVNELLVGVSVKWVVMYDHALWRVIGVHVENPSILL